MHDQPTSKTPLEQLASRWRAIYKVHPTAALFPPLKPEPLRELASHIKAHGLSDKVRLWTDSEGNIWVIDGLNRLDALDMIGITPDSSTWADYIEMLDCEAEEIPHLIVGWNIQRRHLKEKEKVQLAVTALKAGEEFDRLYKGPRSVLRSADGKVRGSEKSIVGKVAAIAKVDRKTARKHLADMGETAQRKPKPSGEPPQSVKPKPSGETPRSVKPAKDGPKLTEDFEFLRQQIDECCDDNLKAGFARPLLVKQLRQLADWATQRADRLEKVKVQ